MPDKRVVVSRSEAATMYDVHPNDLTKAVHSGALVAKMVGRRYRFHVDDLKAWFDALPRA